MFVEEALLPANQRKIRCFGAQAALLAEATRLHARGVAVGFTVNLEVAPKSGDQFNWTRKVTFQLSEHELPLLTSVFLVFFRNANSLGLGKLFCLKGNQPNYSFPPRKVRAIFSPSP